MQSPFSISRIIIPVLALSATLWMSINPQLELEPKDVNLQRRVLAMNQPCGPGEWTTPQSAFKQPAGKRFTAQDPTIAIGDRMSHIAGNNIEIYDGREVDTSPLTIATLKGVLVDLPKGQFNFIRPKIVEDYAGRLHMLWAEPAASDKLLNTGEWGGAQMVSVWAAAYTARTGWTLPKKIVERKNFLWPQTRIWKENVTGDAGQAVIALPVALFVPETKSPVMLLRLNDGRWSVDSISNDIMSGKNAASFASKGVHEIVSYLSADPDADQDVNSVIVQRSADRGRTWSKAQVVSRSGMQPAYSVQVVIGKDGAVHIVWLQSVGKAAAALRHSVSHDYGESWSIPDAYAGARDDRHELRAVIDNCGVLHVIFENWNLGGNRGHLEHAIWDGGWHAPAKLFTGWYSRSADLTLSVIGSPVLAFMKRPAIASVESAFEPAYVEFLRK